MEWTDSAFVLEVGPLREADLWLRLLTPQHGLVSVFAFGGSRSRRRFCGCLDILNMLRVRAKATRNGLYLALQEGVLLGGPRRLRADRRRLGMAMNCVRFMQALGVASDGGASAFTLLREYLSLLEEAETVQDVIPVLFRLRLGSDQGYAPSFARCSSCAAPVSTLDTAFFSVSEGVLYCPACAAAHSFQSGAPSKEGNMEISGGTLDVLRKVQEESPVLWNTTEITPLQRRECSRLVDSFVQYHLGLIWDRGRFRRP